MDGIVYLLDQAGIALAQANKHISEQGQEITALRAALESANKSHEKEGSA